MKEKCPIFLSAEIDRNVNLGQLLKMLSGTMLVKFRMEGESW